jgi:hypothetical protein
VHGCERRLKNAPLGRCRRLSLCPCDLPRGFARIRVSVRSLQVRSARFSFCLPANLTPTPPKNPASPTVDAIASVPFNGDSGSEPPHSCRGDTARLPVLPVARGCRGVGVRTTSGQPTGPLHGPQR